MSVREKQSIIGTLNADKKQSIVGNIGIADVLIREVPTGGGGSVASVQSDWNQNDPDAPDYVKNRPITRVESLDTTSLVNLRDLESGQYILYGYFSPYENSDISITADNSMVSVIRKTAGSHIICLDPLNAKIVFFEILVDETAEKGFAYTRTIVPVLDLNALITKVGVLEELSTDDKSSIVYAINEVIADIPSDEHIREIAEQVVPERDEECADAIKTVNGVAPDENGNVEISAMPDEIEQIKALIEADMIPTIQDVNGAILTDKNGNIILRY